VQRATQTHSERSPNRSAQATRQPKREPSTVADVRTATVAPENLVPSSILRLQLSAGNRAVQRTLHSIDAGSDGGDVIRRRWNPPYLQQHLARAAQIVAGDGTEFTRYVLQATNPLQEGESVAVRRGSTWRGDAG